MKRTLTGNHTAAGEVVASAIESTNGNGHGRREPISHTLFRKHLKELGLRFETEVKFHDKRLWRWDFTLPDNGIAIEINGSIWAGRRGGHTGGKGAQRDMDKRNAGVMCGWRVLTFSSDDVLRGRARAFLAEHLRPAP